jgi:hypothetical protein
MERPLTDGKSFPALANDYSARNVVKFAHGDVNDHPFGEGIRSPDQLVSTSIYSTRGPGSGDAANGPPPPPLPHPTTLRKNLLVAGFVIAGLDLCVMPMVYFYALSYATSLSRQTGMLV